MRREYVERDSPLVPRRYIDQTHDAGMRSAAHNGKLAEILIECDQDSALSVRPPQDFVVTWVVIPRSRMDHVVPGAFEFGRRARPNTGVEEDLQADSRNGSTRSCATSLCAYRRQA